MSKNGSRKRFRDSWPLRSRKEKQEPKVSTFTSSQVDCAESSSEPTQDVISKNQSLWSLAVQDLQKSNPELVEHFTRCLGIERVVGGIQSTEPKTQHLERKALLKITEASDSKETLNGRTAKVRKSLEQVIKLMIASKDFISEVVALNPYAAMAWTGVCFALPVRGRISQRCPYC